MDGDATTGPGGASGDESAGGWRDVEPQTSGALPRRRRPGRARVSVHRPRPELRRRSGRHDDPRPTQAGRAAVPAGGLFVRDGSVASRRRRRDAVHGNSSDSGRRQAPGRAPASPARRPRWTGCGPTATGVGNAGSGRPPTGSRTNCANAGTTWSTRNRRSSSSISTARWSRRCRPRGDDGRRRTPGGPWATPHAVGAAVVPCGLGPDRRRRR